MSNAPGAAPATDAPPAPGSDTPPPTGDTPPPEGDTPPSDPTPSESDDGNTPLAGSEVEPAQSKPTEGDGSDDGDEPSPTQADKIPDNWRELLADGNEKRLKQLRRYTSPQALIEKIENQEKVIRSRKPALEPPGPDASEEDIAKYRKEAGLPETPAGYVENLQLSDGKVIGDDDKPFAESFAEALHQVHAPQEAVNAAVDWYLNMQEQQAADLVQHDETRKRESRDQLRDEWGADYKRNLNAIGWLFSDAPGGADASNPESLFARLITARTQDGRIVGDDPSFIKHLSTLALKYAPNAEITPTGTGDLSSVQSELADLRKLVAKDDSEYWRGPKAKQLQERFAQLLEVEKFLTNRSAS